MTRAPIGVFDSGLGGLTVLRALRAERPTDPVLYIGDTARVPYGTKAPATIRRYAIEIGTYLESAGARAVLVACNTASALALSSLQEALSIPVIGVIEPGARAATTATRSGKIGVLATRSTVASGAYQTAILALAPEARVYAREAPLFVPLVEEGHLDDEIALLAAHMYLDEILSKGIDTLLLGCTHYPLLAPLLRRVAGSGVRIVDSANALIATLGDRLGPPPDGPVEPIRYLATDDPEAFRAGAERFLGERLAHVERLAPERLETARPPAGGRR